jgi:hypothetical protein
MGKRMRFSGLKFSKTIYMDWQPHDRYEKYANYDRVCYGNLEPGEATQEDDKGVKYSGYLNNNLKACIDLDIYATSNGLAPEVIGDNNLYNIDHNLIVCKDEPICSYHVIDDYVYKVYPDLTQDCAFDPSAFNAANQNPQQTCEITNAGTVVCEGEVVTIGPDKTVVTGDSYQWFEDAFGTGGLSNLTIRNPDFTYLSSFTPGKGLIYRLKIIENQIDPLPTKETWYCEYIYLCYGCNSPSSIRVSDAGRSNLNSGSISNFEIYPNPMLDELSVKYEFIDNMTANEYSEETILQVVDNTGRIFLTKSLSSKKGLVKLNLDNLEDGIYYVEINNGNQKLVKTVIKH